MSEKIIAYYDDYTSRAGEDARATSSRSAGLEFYYTKKALGDFITKESRVLEIGAGTGYYGMYFADQCKEYVGIELYQPHVDIFNQKIRERGLTNITCQLGNALNLESIPDNSFDVVCCLGPMYHLPPQDRALAFAECARVCRPGGIAAFAYINKVGVYAGACVLMEHHYPNAEANNAILEQGISDDRPGVFYFTMPEDMEAAASKHDLVKIRNMGTDFFITMGIIDRMDDEKFALYMALADEMVKYESCTGMSNHALLICRK
ncbi:MAG: class I SAM-dependent methyltransferase [Defluviitaleaceae bacterium]|nr:class I SAM-dependent methyltransferase [Defluviitaleaceae bacterium]